MRAPEEMGFYAELGADGELRAVHGVKHLMPADAVAISEDQAKEISAAVRAKAPQTVTTATGAFLAPPAPAVDLKPILDQLAAHAALIQSHAATLDQHEGTITAQGQTVAAAKSSVEELMTGIKKLVPEKP
jgi:hypothetical protein